MLAPVRKLLAIVIAGCGSTPPPAATEVPTVADTPAPDAEPAVSEAVRSAPAWVFRYRTVDRDETWTLRYADGDGVMEVVTPQGTTTYVGAATEGDELVLALRAPTAAIGLRCKTARRAIGEACNDAKAPEIDVLDCYHPDFEAPMPFAAAPGIEYVVDATCNGYRLAR